MDIFNKRKTLNNTIRAQYHSYRKADGIDSKSMVETYFKVVTEINDIK